MRSWYPLLALVLLGLGIGAVYILSTDTRSKGRDTIETTQNDIPDMSTTSLSLTSGVFKHGEMIPSRFTCDGENMSPPIAWSGVPAETKSLVLLMDDPDIPQVFKDQRGIDSFDHWTLFNIPTTTVEIGTGGTAGTRGANGAGRNQYTGPCPPPEYEPSEHRYFFRLYALDAELALPEGAKKAEVIAAMQGHIISQAELMGKYKRTP